MAGLPVKQARPKDGIILAFRRQDCVNSSIRVKLRGLDEKATYELFFEDYDLRIKNTGKELMNGFDVGIPQKPASLLVSYKMVN
ncbi:MAG: hypothetical protein Q8891_04475 [Bacteroidota bacterium]|nr:hypothetical protein [Bacteroidota bacterium]